MRDKNEVLQNIIEQGIIAVIRAPDADRTLKLARAIRKGGIGLIEITMTVPGALDILKQLVADKDVSAVIGAGTVLDAETARLAILAGAEYIVSPHFNAEVVRLCHRYRKVCIPGAMSVKEVVEVMESGADAVKVFPAVFFGPDFIREILGPFPQAQLIPSTGVNLKNLADWFAAGVFAVFVGGDLIDEALATDNYSLAEKKARQFVARMKEIKSG